MEILVVALLYVDQPAACMKFTPSNFCKTKLLFYVSCERVLNQFVLYDTGVSRERLNSASYLRLQGGGTIEVTALYHRWRNFLDVLQTQETGMNFKQIQHSLNFEYSFVTSRKYLVIFREHQTWTETLFNS